MDTNKIISKQVFIDEAAGTVTVHMQLEICRANEQPIKVKAEHIRGWLLQNKGIVAGQKVSGQARSNNLSGRRFGLNNPSECRGTWVFKWEDPNAPKSAPKAKPTPKAKPVAKAKPAPKAKPVAKKTTTRRKRTTKKSKGE